MEQRQQTTTRLEDIVVNGFYEMPKIFDHEISPQDQFKFMGVSSRELPSGQYVVGTQKGFFDAKIDRSGNYIFSHPERVREVYGIK